MVGRATLLAALAATAWCIAVESVPARAASAAAPYVVVVDYTAPADQFARLKDLVLGIAAASIAEPGCRRFDVVSPAGHPDHLTLYEVFDDETAFAAHAATPTFKRFAVESGAIGATRSAMPGTMVLSLHSP